MRKVINREHVEGYVYEHDLSIRTVQNTESSNYGKEFIRGTLDIATDEALKNIVTINFTYVTEVTSKGKKNDTFTALKNIIDNGKTVTQDGKENATVVRVDTALGVNDFYSERAKTDNNPEGLVSVKKNEGGFVHIINASNLEDEDKRNKFEIDFLINGTRFVEANEETGADEYLILKGAAFDFKKAMLPVELVVRSREGIQYFESLDISQRNMVFTKLWGNIVGQQTKIEKTEESAFGGDNVVEYTQTKKEWVVIRAAKQPYEIGDETNGITFEEIKKAIEDRNVYLADVKRRQDEYEASKNTGNPASNVGNPGVTAAAGGFNF